MHNILKISQYILIAFSITCLSLIFWQNGEGIFSVIHHVHEQNGQMLYASREIVVAIEKEPVIHLPNLLTITAEAAEKNKSTLITVSEPTNNSASIWADIGSQFKLNDEVQNPRVQSEMRKILADKKSFETILNRAAPYIYYIYNQTQAKHLPAELSLIPIIESEYNPNNRTNHALGLWQLLPGTAKGLGVKINNDYDGRRNLIDSTNAALNFFSDLNKEFNGHWDLAIAAYNCGPGCVSSAVKKAKSNNFFDLKLPLETKVYVPRLLAIAEIIKHAEKYGITLPPIENTPFFKEVQVKNAESLEDYAKSTNSDLNVLKKLNPETSYQHAGATSTILLVPLKAHTM